MFTSIDNGVGMLHFISFIAKIVVDCAEALYVRILGRWYIFFALVFDEMLNRKDGCGNVTV